MRQAFLSQKQPMSKIKELEQKVATLNAELNSKTCLLKKINDLLLSGGQNDSVAEPDTPPTMEKESIAEKKLWSSISHEILTPMDAILGITDLMMDSDLTEEQRGYLEMINASADRLFGVVSDVIDYSELTGGKLRRDIVNFDLFQALEYDLYIAELSAKHKDLKFRYTFSKDIPVYLKSDPERLRQVLNNLLSNAIKYTHQGEISVQVETVGYDENNRLLLKFTVTDTGDGVSPEIQETIFQTPSGFTVSGGEEKYSEVGLGLVVSAKLVTLFGGEIGLDNREQGKTTFWFTWPMVNPAEAYMGELPPHLISEKRDEGQILQGATVLLAEDEHINASITKAFLEQVGMVVTVVGDGVEALERLEDKSFDAVLMDIQMPVMNGLETTLEIRRKEKTNGGRCPVIALTAHAMHGDREKCLQAGMDDYIAKPLDRDLLIDMLASYITKKALIVGSEPLNQQETLQPLVEKGWAVALAETGRLAMYEASHCHFNLIVIDASMVLKDGLETVVTIRSLEQYSGYRATIVALGITDSEEVARYQESGVDMFYPRSEVAEAIGNLETNSATLSGSTRKRC